MEKYYPVPVLYLLIFFLSCNLEQEIEIELPAYEERVVVEAYLEPGQPLRLLLSRSAPFFDDFPVFEEQFIRNTLIRDAEVRILYKDSSFLLTNRLSFDENRRKIYNYQHPFVVPKDYENPFELSIHTKEGHRIRATTRLLSPVPIDSLVIEFKEQDTLARVLTYLTDPSGETNYYRRLLHKGSLLNAPEQDFTLSDRIADSTLLFGTGFDYAAGDTIISTVYHLDPAYYDFLRSVQNAEQANGNPFAQPSPIISNMENTDDLAIGIFTGLSYSRVTAIVNP